VTRSDLRRAVVTGAAGFIGSHLVEALLERGHHVVGIDAFTPYYDPMIKRANIAAACRHAAFDLLPARLDEVSLEEVLQPGDLVFHLAAQPGVRASWGDGFRDYTRDNVDATQRLLEASRHCGVSRIVYASSSSVYGDAPLPMAEDGPLRPVSPYGVTKLTAEQLGDVYHSAVGLDVVPLRFFTVYGPRQRPDMAFHRFIDAIATGRPVTLFGDGTQRRDFTYVGDVVRVLIAAAERGEPGRAINVAGGSTMTVGRVLELIEALVGRRAIIERHPAPPGDARDTEAATDRLHQLGVPAQVGVEEGLRRQVEWQLGLARRRGDASERRSASVARPQRAGTTVMLYSHDTYGLGHLRRNLAVAHALVARDSSARVVMVSGSRAATEWRLPPRVSVVNLPPAIKTGAEEYRPVGAGTLHGLVAQRSGLIAATLLRVRPDVVLVDHAPLGMKGELRLALAMAREELPNTRLVLGLRDILDDPAVVRRTWAEQDVETVLRQLYDTILVYGCRDLYDVTDHYGFDDVLRRRTSFTGYIGKDATMEGQTPANDAWTQSTRQPTGRVLVLGGGGGDAAGVFHATLDAWPSLKRVTGAHALLVAGPLMDEAEFERIEARAAALRADVGVLRFSRNVLSLIRAADVVVTMGGYNSVTEVVAARRPALVCPRVTPRREQLIRAEAFARRGLVHLHRVEEGGPAGMAEAILRTWAAGAPSQESWRAVDFGGVERVTAVLLDEGGDDVDSEAVA
jgi:UDP-glucose 4-epimerase